VLAGPVTATQTTRDAISAIEDVGAQVHDLLGRALLDDITNTRTGGHTGDRRQRQRPVLQEPRLHALHRVAARAHTRCTRRRSPQTNGVIERYHGAIQIEDLWRDLPADGADMTTRVEAFRQLYNHIRPHENLAGARPIDRYLADPDDTSITPPSTRQPVRLP
jgi:transposase InsO family protein